MDLPSYIAYRMYCDVNMIPTRYNIAFEKVFRELTDFALAYTEQYAARMFHKIPENRTSIDELLTDTKDIFTGITKELGTVDSVLAIRSLFIPSYYLMIKYKKDPQMCGHVSFWFDVFTHKSKGWEKMLGAPLDINN